MTILGTFLGSNDVNNVSCKNYQIFESAGVCSTRGSVTSVLTSPLAAQQSSGVSHQRASSNRGFSFGCSKNGRRINNPVYEKNICMNSMCMIATRAACVSRT